LTCDAQILIIYCGILIKDLSDQFFGFKKSKIQLKVKATKKEKEDLERKMSTSKRASLRRKLSMMEEVKKKGVPGTLFKPKESKPYKKSLIAAEIRAQENAKALRKISMVK